jgi:hypothetical protein
MPGVAGRDRGLYGAKQRTLPPGMKTAVRASRVPSESFRSPDRNSCSSVIRLWRGQTLIEFHAELPTGHSEPNVGPV